MWTRLAAVGNTTAARLVILIPIVGYWIILNDWVSQRVALWFEVAGEPKHVPWRLFMTYFGLCFMALGSAVYQLCGPVEIKRFTSITDYVDRSFTNISDIELIRVDDAVENGDEISRSLYAFHGLQTDRIRSRQDQEDLSRNLLTLYFNQQNRSAPVARKIA